MYKFLPCNIPFVDTHHNDTSKERYRLGNVLVPTTIMVDLTNIIEQFRNMLKKYLFFSFLLIETSIE